jgi:toxin CptA
MRFAHGISFDVRPSPLLSRFVLLIVALATVAPLFTSLPWIARLALAGVIAAVGLLRAAHGRSARVQGLDWAFDGLWTVREHSGRAFPAELVASRVVGTSVFLHFRWDGRAGHVALLPDNTDAGHLRVLRARLSAAR